MTCPRCGSEATGRFCSTCGAALGGGNCPSCNAPLSPGAKFCHACGATVGGAPGGSGMPAGAGGSGRNVVPWVIAAVAVVALIVVAALQLNRAPQTAAQTAAVPGQPPADEMATTDISNMSPKQAAQRLFDRVMRSAQAGDTQQVSFFGPMTVQAYARVPTLGNDDHYDIGLINGLLNQPEAELAEADTIAKAVPTHLFASMLRYDVAHTRNDSGAMRRAAQNFLNHYTAEMKANRPEYADRTSLIQSYHDQFEKLLGRSGK